MPDLKLKVVALIGGFLLISGSLVKAEPAAAERLQLLLPEKLGSFTRVGQPQTELEDFSSGPARSELAGSARYGGRSSEKLLVGIRQYRHDADAYSRLTLAAQIGTNPSEIGSVIGTAAILRAGEVLFVKGRSFVRISASPEGAATRAMLDFARILAEKLDNGEGEIPVLIKHLPQWEQAQKTALFISRFTTLDSLIEKPAVNAIAGEGDADAVVARYGSTQVLLIEFNTPQLATENDKRIIATIRELWQLGQPAPSAYRRVGNYSVFVFDAPDEKSAKQLIDQVKYEQVVQWLGENPNLYKQAEKLYIETTLGVFITVIKTSGYAFIGCLGIGGLIGSLLFMRRRSQQRSVEAFSDAGGMMRLNLDEMTPQTDPARLIRDRN